jgi:hypothetical protein
MLVLASEDQEVFCLVPALMPLQKRDQVVLGPSVYPVKCCYGTLIVESLIFVICCIVE